MDWDRAIAQQHEALRRLMLMAFVLLGTWATGRMPRGTHRALLRLLRPAESAVRRLVVIVAHRMKGPTVLPRPGLPPGYRRKSMHRADRVLDDCHALAFHALHGSPDTS